MGDQEPVVADVGNVEAEAGAVEQTPDAGSDPLFSDGPFTWKHTNGELSISNRAELADAMRRSFIHADEREQERQAIEAERASMKQAMNRYRTQEQQLNSAYGAYSQWDKLMKERPEVHKEIQAIIDRAKGSNVSQDQIKAAVEAELAPFRGDWEKMQQERKTRAQDDALRAAAEQLKSEYPDFDEAAARQFIADLRRVPEADVSRTMLQLAYHAIKGRNGVAALEARGAQAPKKPLPSVTSTPGKTHEEDASELSEEQLHQRAVEALRNSK